MQRLDENKSYDEEHLIHMNGVTYTVMYITASQLISSTVTQKAIKIFKKN